MNCKYVQDWLLSADDETFGGGEKIKQAVREHLKNCAACREFERELNENVLNPLRAAPPVPPPERIWLKIKKEIAEETSRPVQQPTLAPRLADIFRWPHRPAYALGAVLLLMLIFLAVFHPSRNNQCVSDYIDDQTQFFIELAGDADASGNGDGSLGTSIEEFFL